MSTAPLVWRFLPLFVLDFGCDVNLNAAVLFPLRFCVVVLYASLRIARALCSDFLRRDALLDEFFAHPKGAFLREC